MHLELAVTEQPCPSLTKLTINSRDMTDLQFSTLFSHCPNLTDLNLQRCRLISDISLAALAQDCSKLSSLELEDSDVRRLTIPGVATLPTLRKLTISDMTVDSATLNALAAGRCALTLTEITVGNCTGVTADEILSFISSFRRLSRLNIFGYNKSYFDKMVLKMQVTAAYPHLHVWVNGYDDN